MALNVGGGERAEPEELGTWGWGPVVVALWALMRREML